MTNITKKTVLDNLELRINPDGLRYERKFSPTDDPYKTIKTEKRDVVLKNWQTEEVVFEQLGIEIPVFWSENATSIFAQHYLRGRLNTDDRETSVFQAVDRVVDTIVKWATTGRKLNKEGGPYELAEHLQVPSIFADEQSAINYAADLKYLIVTQQVNFNSPVWYNIGVANVAQQPSACFILSIDDDMSSILNWYKEEGTIFKGGSGSGINLSDIRSSYEGMSGGGRASGPCAYMRAADSNAGTIASGGRTRRAAKMVVLDIDHPDILEMRDGGEGFIKLKVRAEEVARTLSSNGFRVSVGDNRDGFHVQFQNANNSVRISNDFMEAVVAKDEWQTKARREDLIMEDLPKYDAEMLWTEIAKAAHECADPGLQFDSVTNFWHSTPAAGRINASNPCSEYMHIDNSPCNLAATNLLKFIDSDGNWMVEEFKLAVKVVSIAQTVMAKYGDYPTEEVRDVATSFLQIGQGYTNLGALLMSSGFSYDSDEGRALTATITSLMQSELFATSSEIAKVWGVYPGDPSSGRPGYNNPTNRKAHNNVAQMHSDYTFAIASPANEEQLGRSINFASEKHINIFHEDVVGGGLPVQNHELISNIWQAAIENWDHAIESIEVNGLANAHMSVLAPMGTNGFMMDNDTTGIEPDLALKKNKQKVSGDTMVITNQAVESSLLRLGYSASEAEEIVAYVETKNSIVDAPHVKERHYSVFDTAFTEPIGGRYLSILAHQKIMAAAQPFLSGAISKTVNMPETATVEDVKEAHFQSWRLGLKAVAIYRNNSKAHQPMSSASDDEEDEKETKSNAVPTEVKTVEKIVYKAMERKMPSTRDAKTIKVTVGDFKIYTTVGLFEDNTPGEIFIRAGKQGSTFSGFLDAVAIAISVGLQHGVPLEDLISKYVNMEFEPKGPTDSDNFTFTTSVMDIVARELAVLFLAPDVRARLGIKTNEEKLLDSQSAPGQIAASFDAKIEKKEVAEEPTQEAIEQSIDVSTVGLGGLQDNSPLCSVCGRQMTKTGTCAVCESCGMTSGCS